MPPPRARLAIPALLTAALVFPLSAAAASEQGRSVVSALESPASDREVAAQLEAAPDGHGDWLASLFTVFRESRRETQESQKYWLGRLEEYDDVNAAIGEYLNALNEQLQQLAETTRADEEPDAERTRAIDHVVASLDQLEARTRAVPSLPDNVRKQLESRAQRERRLLDRARRIIRQSSAASPPAEERVRRKAIPTAPPPDPDRREYRAEDPGR